MTLFDWLATPGGEALTRALSLLLTATAAYIAFLARQQSKKNQDLLDGHLAQHVEDATSGKTEGLEHNP